MLATNVVRSEDFTHPTSLENEEQKDVEQKDKTIRRGTPDDEANT